MKQQQEQQQEQNKSLSRIPSNKSSNQLSYNFPDIDKLEAYAIKIKNSIFAKDFRETDEKGDYIVENDGGYKTDVGGIIANMALGYEMGLSFVSSLVLGKKLNANSILAVMRGRELGFDASVSIAKIYAIPTQNGIVISTGYDIISAIIVRNGGEIKHIRKAEIVPTYKELGTNSYIGHKYDVFDNDGNIKPEFYIYIDKETTPPNEIAEAKKAGKFIITQAGRTKVTTVRLIRKDKNYDETYTYSLQDATNAGLYRGVNSITGEAVDGKANWNNHPETHLNHRPITILGRIGFADKLLGMTDFTDAIDIVNAENRSDIASTEELAQYAYDKTMYNIKNDIIEEAEEAQ